jgi:SAM-dependent methyltransferase
MGPNASMQGELWGRNPGAWADLLETQTRPLYEATVEALEPLAGQRLLDAGCGSGLALYLAAERGALVSGLDASAALLEVARQRVADVDLREGDIESLPYADATFDVVTAFNAVQYATDPRAAVAELARVCRPSGTVAIGVWGDPGRCETEVMFARLRALAPPPPGTAAPLAISAAGVVEGLLGGARLELVGGAEVGCSFRFTDLEQAWTAQCSAGPVQRVIDIAGADAVRTVVDEVFEAHRKPGGELRQDNVFRYVMAQKPPR